MNGTPSSCSKNSKYSKDSSSKRVKIVAPLGSGKDMEISQKDSLLAKLANSSEDPNQAFQTLRKELLLSKNRGSNAVAESKHYYLVDASNATTTEKTLCLCKLTGGTATNTRTTNTVAVKHSTIRISIRRVANAPSTVVGYQPIITFVFWRDKIPSTVGTAPTLYGTDALPPASTTLMFSRLGDADAAYNPLAVRNPITALDYHIYQVHHHCLNSEATYDFTTPATGYGMPSPQRWKFEYKIDLHDVRQDYATYAATDPDVNALYMTYVLDSSVTSQGYDDQVHVTVDTEFEDLQDGE